MKKDSLKWVYNVWNKLKETVHFTTSNARTLTMFNNSPDDSNLPQMCLAPTNVTCGMSTNSQTQAKSVVSTSCVTASGALWSKLTTLPFKPSCPTQPEAFEPVGRNLNVESNTHTCDKIVSRHFQIHRKP